MSLAKLAGLHPAVRDHARLTLDWARHYGMPEPTITSGYRSMDEQARLRRAWEQGQARWPVNQPGDSAHNYGLAWDSSGIPEAWWPFWTWLREALGWRVPPNDRVHAEVPGWRGFVGR